MKKLEYDPLQVTMLARNWGELLQAGLTITSVTMGSVLGVFLLGTWTAHTSQRAALAGMISGLLVTLGIHFSGAVAWTWYVLIGTAITFLVGGFLPSRGRARNRTQMNAE